MESTQSGTGIDWGKIAEKLPTKKGDKEQRKRRFAMFKLFDPNGNGYLSLAELDLGIRNILQLDQVFDCKPAIIQAYKAARNKGKAKSKYSGDYVDKHEFRFFLLALRQYFEYWAAFARVDTGDDRRIDRDEFKKAQKMIEVWVGPIKDMDKEFDQIDTNGGGQILFGEFCRWAIKRGLDLEDDDDYDEDGQ